MATPKPTTSSTPSRPSTAWASRSPTTRRRATS
jgi:hypothetical protein